MLKRMSVVICGLAVMGMTAGYASAQTATEKTKTAAKNAGDATADAAITTAVKTKLLADSKVGGLKIDVDTKDNVVTLTGPVHSVAERTEAVRLARTTTGVKRVISKLVVEPASKTAVQKTEDAAKKAGKATEEAAKDTGANITDAAITSAVKTKLLADTKVGGLKINVDTNNHVVTLTGTVKSAAEKAEAIRLASTTKGVDKVVDKLTIQ
jgi:hyperosmotically inducible protein